MSSLLFERSEQSRLIDVAVPRPIDTPLTYRVERSLDSRIESESWIGRWVRVPLGRAEVCGVIVSEPRETTGFETETEKAKLRSVIEMGSKVLSGDLLKLCEWVHRYYQAPLGEVIGAAVPYGLLNKRTSANRPRKVKAHGSSSAAETPHVPVTLTPDQESALSEIRQHWSGGRSTVLLEGVTGSGKTEVYLQLARETLAHGNSVLVLVPEIALTPQLHERFERALSCQVGLWHSALPDGKKRRTWEALLSGDLRVLVGARSAVFSPIQNLGLIVVDEEHDSTFKQEDRVRYHARDVAIVRASQAGSKVILGSATPSFETLVRSGEGKYGHVHLRKRVHSAGLPQIEIVDLSEVALVEGTRSILAETTIDRVREVLSRGEQAMVFLNRRGYAPFLLCRDCGQSWGCPHCSISLTLHRKRSLLRCHLCGFERGIPDFCESCQSVELEAIGAGTESLEEDLQRLVPEAKILRLDRDQVTSQTRLIELLETFRFGQANLLVGTQMLVKGHDFPQVTLVVVSLADSLFKWPDFRAGERALQTLTQVAGRAGRGHKPGTVLVQTFSPEHPLLKVIQGLQSRDEFIRQELDVRRELLYPPYSRMARLRVEGSDLNEVKSMAHEVVKRAEEILQRLSLLGSSGQWQVLGPSEAFIEKAKGLYRWDVLLKCQEVGWLQTVIQNIRQNVRQNLRQEIRHNVKGPGNSKKIFIQIDVDPQVIG